ncbi:MAG: metal ABC transporter permease [Gemmatimonadota bacterium]|nr:metal ABC transporter permease [Gemmatimonadota bacterium]MDE3128773.1 metal ABC transporter permease [Gemmatimonadota bacterium]MDE3172590.1 metal ABC transporter permease [Gemmatimonadota bacterium]MDE3215932.1 metal ABC transporter permease [Gemmatimonadota bacterium]
MPATSTLVLAVLMAVAAGLVGSVAVMRRMTLASDAISHVALPGVGLALILHFNPVLGALAALLVGTLLVWLVERQTRIPTEAIIGVVFSAALAVGSMMASGEELIDALFGGAQALGRVELLLGIVGALLVIAFMLWARSELVIALVSQDLARTSGVKVERVNLIFLLGFALTVALGLRFLGVLLMGSLIIIPAATAKQLARSLGGMQAIAVGIAVGVTLAGAFAAPALHLEAGPVSIVLAAMVFFVSLLLRRPA